MSKKVDWNISDKDQNYNCKSSAGECKIIASSRGCLTIITQIFREKDDDDLEAIVICPKGNIFGQDSGKRLFEDNFVELAKELPLKIKKMFSGNFGI